MAVQSETLNDFINRRMKTLQIGYKGMTNAGVGAWTFKKIREDPTRLSEAEFQKIAYALRCSIGDLKACLPNSIRKGTGHDMDLLAKEIGEPSVMKTVAKLEQMVEQEYPELRDAADYGTDPQNSGTVPEEIVEKSFENETISDDTPNDPVEPVTKALDFNCIENAKPKRKTKKIVQTDIKDTKPDAGEPKPQTVDEYKQQLKDMCLRKFLLYRNNARVDTALTAIGQALVKELVGL